MSEHKGEVYNLLADKMLSTAEIAAIPIEDNGETMVKVEATEYLLTRQIEKDMLAITGEDIYVRETVAKMLGQASLKLNGVDSGYQLEVVYGYRHPDIQLAKFNELKDIMAVEHPEWGEADLYDRTSFFRAPLEIAGHPTGSSVDLCVYKDGEPIDVGTKNQEFTSDTTVFSPYISREAWRNRQLIRWVMMSCEFAPYDGEWWHFSYGDREWASYYRKTEAFYGPVEFKTV